MNESVEDNGNSVMNHRSSSNADSLEKNGFNPGDDQEESIGSPQQSNNNVVSFRAESPGGSTRKGYGLKKWRRIKRDGPVVKDEAAPVDDGSKPLKRNLTGLANPPTKHVDVSSSVEARQSSEGSVGSVNMVNHHHHNGFSPDTGFMFTVGQAFEKSEEHSGNSSIGAKNVGGKIVSGSSIRKGSEERVKAKKEKPCSSLDSDLRSSDFVFSTGAVSVNHISGEFSKEDQVREEVQTYNRSENGEKDEDPLADSIRGFADLQEALLKEVQSFQELGKETTTPLHSNIDENCSVENSTSSGSQLPVLKQKLKHLEHKLDEVRAVLEAKEVKIQELENSKIESELEGVFLRKIETEIEHLIFTRSLKSLQVLKQPTEDTEPRSGNILGKTCKFGFYFLTQMILLVSIFWFLVLQLSPPSRLVIPT